MQRLGREKNKCEKKSGFIAIVTLQIKERVKVL